MWLKANGLQDASYLLRAYVMQLSGKSVKPTIATAEAAPCSGVRYRSDCFVAEDVGSAAAGPNTVMGIHVVARLGPSSRERDIGLSAL